MVFPGVVRCRCRWKWIGCAWNHCRSRWDHVDIVLHRQIMTTSGIPPPSWISGWRKRRVRSACTPEKNPPPPQKKHITIEIGSTSVSVAKLLVIPVLGIVSTSGLYLMVSSIVERCRRRWNLIGSARKLCRSRWDYVEITSRRLVITTYVLGGFLVPVCICCQEKSAL